MFEKLESPGSQRTAVILFFCGVTLLVCGFGQLVFVMPQTFEPFTETRNDKTERMILLLEKVESYGSQQTAVILVFRGITVLVFSFCQLVYVMPHTLVPFTETRNDETKWMNVLLEKMDLLRCQRTVVILVLSGVTLLVWCFGQLVFVMLQTFLPFTGTRIDRTKWINLLLEKVESPGSQRTAVIPVLREVTLLVCVFGELAFVMPQIVVAFTETRDDKTKRMNLLLERVESPGSQRTGVILVSRGVTRLVCGFGQLVFVMPQTFVPFTKARNVKTEWIHFLLRRWCHLDLSVQRSFWLCVDLRCWGVVLASWFA